MRIADQFPQGLTFVTFDNLVAGPGVVVLCPSNPGGTGFICDAAFDASSSLSFDVTVNVAADAPCGTVNNIVTLSGPLEEGILASASDPTRITGGTCPTGTGTGGGGGGGGGSILPVDLNGVVTLFNNINTNNNLHSPGATNTTNQNLGINAP